MKISFKPKIHNCDKHLKVCYISSGYNQPRGDIGFVTICEICKRKKEHIEYGCTFIKNYKPC